MNTRMQGNSEDRKASDIEEERDAYKEALEEILDQCRQAETSPDEDAYQVAVEAQIPHFANEVLTIYAPDPEPVSDEELPFQ